MLSPLHDSCCGQKHAFQTVSTLEGRNAARNVADRKAGRRVPPPSDAAKDASISSIAQAHDLNHFLHNEGLFLRLPLIGLTFLTHPPNKRKRISNPLHTVSRKHVVQPGNRSKTLRTGLSLNVPQSSGETVRSALQY
ncbi:hypothetical protein DPX16_15612 [Anabarilius grahami]|uniref:Uncharacterized protein n=1 Tax=Anabarilius grahami TaxID=495550 RepID=A0A3N0YD17_ANAGA|nr:hypothetical protein DPX16_15612 [Anabarilius grahami]